MMNLTQPPPTFLHDVTKFAVYLKWNRPLVETLVNIDKYREENISLSQSEANSTRQQNSSMGASDSRVDYQNSWYINK